jgi:hypothetical protein
LLDDALDGVRDKRERRSFVDPFLGGKAKPEEYVEKVKRLTKEDRPKHAKTSLSGRLECAAGIIRGAVGEKGIDLS